MLTHALPYLALGALLHLALTINVIRLRRRAQVSMGTGGDARLARAVRAFGNCAEHLPFGLLLLVAMELAGAAPWLLHLWGLLFVGARVVHAVGFVRNDVDLRPRTVGMLGTLLGYAAAAAILLGAFAL